MLTESEKPGPLAWSVAEADPTPILLITAGNAPDEAKAARYLRDSGENVSVWNVPGANHIEGLDVDPDRWEQTVIAFLEKVIG